MDKLQKLEMMDKMIRELEDVKNSQEAVLKKVSQVEAENINVGIVMLEKALPDIHERVDANVLLVSDILTQFAAHREKFYTDNKLAALIDPTA